MVQVGFGVSGSVEHPSIPERVYNVWASMLVFVNDCKAV